MKHSILTPEMLQIGSEIIQWSHNYLSQENENIKRPRGSQIVCPFVKPSIDNNSYFLAFHPEINGKSVDNIAQLMLEYIDDFKKIGPFDSGSRFKKALVIVFNNLPIKESYVLDIVHQNIKDSYVSSGLMVGQFHSNCNERGFYNRKFKVSKAPHPLFAIRNMAIHDILFLKENRDWFMAYNTWYGHKFKKGELDQHTNHLEDIYIETKEKYGI